jgi:hypothetical protein
VTQFTIPTELLPDVIEGGDIQCFLLFTETVPSGAYIDSDQINSLKNYGGPDVRFFFMPPQHLRCGGI